MIAFFDDINAVAEWPDSTAVYTTIDQELRTHAGIDVHQKNNCGTKLESHLQEVKSRLHLPEWKTPPPLCGAKT